MKAVKSLFKVYEISIEGCIQLLALLWYLPQSIYVVTAGFLFPKTCLFFPDVLFQCLGQSFLNNFAKDFACEW